MPPRKRAPAKKAPAKKAAAKKAAAPPVPRKASARALTSFEEKFAKRFGEAAIKRPTKRKYQVVSTGSITLDLAMGCGGYIVGRITEIWGPESVNKTTISLIGVGNFQREFPDKMAAWLDIERTFDPVWAETHGVNLDRLMVFYPETTEEASDMASQAAESGLFSVVVLDSVGGMITKEEMDPDRDAEKASVGTSAKVITRMVKKAAVLCDRTQTTMIIVNQVRAIISTSGGNTTSGGWALKHVTTHKIRLRRTNSDPYEIGTGENKEQVGFEVAAIVEKNKVAPPKRIGTFAVFHQETPQFGPIGIDRAREAYTVGKQLGIIQNPTQGYYLLPGDEKPTHGEPKTIARLREDPEMLDKVRREMLVRIADEVATEVPVDVPDAPESSEEIDMLNFTTGLDSLPQEYQADARRLDEIRDDERAEAKAQG